MTLEDYERALKAPETGEKVITLRIPAPLHRKVRKKAGEDGKSMNRFLTDLLLEKLEDAPLQSESLRPEPLREVSEGAEMSPLRETEHRDEPIVRVPPGAGESEVSRS